MVWDTLLHDYGFIRERIIKESLFIYSKSPEINWDLGREVSQPNTGTIMIYTEVDESPRAILVTYRFLRYFQEGDGYGCPSKLSKDVSLVGYLNRISIWDYVQPIENFLHEQVYAS